MAKLKLKKGDDVVVVAGKDIGKHAGTITRVFPDRNRVIVTGSGVGGGGLINVAKKHQKPRGQVMQGGIIDKEMPMDISNVALWCKDCGATRIGYRFATDGTKHRICRKCGSEL